MSTETADETIFGLTGKLFTEDLKPGSPEWLRAGISSSRITMLMKLSQYGNWFKLWHQMAGNIAYEDAVKPEQRRGHLLEPAVLQWFYEEHPTWRPLPAQASATWHHPDNPKHLTSPDNICVVPGEPIARIVEAKTATKDEDWGRPGSDDIPPGYFCQCQWHMYVTGAQVAHVPMLGGYLGFAEYIVERDDDYIAKQVEIANSFLESLPWGSSPELPNLDGHTETYETVRRLRPGIEEGSVTVPYDVAKRFRDAVVNLAAAEQQKNYAYAEVLDLIGPFKSAVYVLGQGTEQETTYPVASRIGGKKVPFLKASSRLTKDPLPEPLEHRGAPTDERLAS